MKQAVTRKLFSYWNTLRAERAAPERADIDPAAKQVVLKDGGTFGYDYLIVATGSKTSYFGNDGWREWAPSLKTIEEATAIRHKILYAFEAAERVIAVNADPHADMLKRADLAIVADAQDVLPALVARGRARGMRHV